MAHFAELDTNNRVVRINVGPDHMDENEITTRTGITTKQCSYNTKAGVHYDPITGEPSADQSKAFRLNYPGIGWIYDETINGFRPEVAPFPSWTLNTTTGLYDPPIAKPVNEPDGFLKQWDEELYQSDNTQGWVDWTPKV
jgi:hypothetical protein